MASTGSSEKALTSPPSPSDLFRGSTNRLSSDAAFGPQNMGVDTVVKGAYGAVALKVRGGSAPFTWLANGRPVASRALRRESSFKPSGPGFSILTVIDAKGRTDQVQFRLTE